MIFQSFLLGNLVSLCMKIINSVVVVGLYYGFLTTFSIGPSYLFLLQAQVMEEGEEGTEKKVSATTGFIMGQLMMFISIYYTPLHLALGRPHTITVLALPYLLFHFFWNNHKHFFDYGSTSRNSMRNLSIQCVFLNNLIFQLFNHFILPSSMLARLVNIYMFRCNNKMLFVTSSFVGWLIGHILFMKWVGLVLVWIQQNHNVLIRSNKYLVSELRNSMARIFSILLFITCVYYLGRMPSPIFTKKLKEASETKESEEETDVEIEKTSETKETKQEEEGFTEEDPSPSLFSEEKEDPDKIDETEKIRVNGKDKTKDEFNFHLKEACYKNSPTSYSGNQDISKLEILKEENKNFFWFEKPLLSLLFDYKRWNRPTRYIKNNRFENPIRNEMSQYFFYTCQNDGKQRISFTYPPSLSIFWEMIQRKISLSTTEKLFYDELYNYWIYNNEQKKNSLRNEIVNRIEILDKGLFYINALEKKTRFCKNKKEYLPKIHDPFLNGFYRGIFHFFFSPSIIKKNPIDKIFINKIHSIFYNDYNCHEFEQKIDTFDKKSVSTEIWHLKSKFDVESTLNLKGSSLLPEQGKIGSEDREKFLKFFVDAIIADSFTQQIQKKSIGIKEINKKVLRWSYKLIDELEQEEKFQDEGFGSELQIRSRPPNFVVLFIDNEENEEIINKLDQTSETTSVEYSQQSDFRRDVIKGSMRVQRRKIVISELYQANIRSPLFLDRIEKSFFFFFNLSELIKQIFKNRMEKPPKLKISDYTEKEIKRGDKKKEYEIEIKKEQDQEKTRKKVRKTWETSLYAQIARSLLLVIQSILRKYIFLPLLIIAKNIGRVLLFQNPEWAEDFEEWNREIHIKCTYNGVQLSERAFPKNWLIEGIQIKIIFPFCLKPWRRSRIQPSHRVKQKEQNKKNSFCFLTVWGMETELPFGSPRKRPSFFKPILKEFKKKIKIIINKYLRVLKIINEKLKLFLRVPNEIEINKWIIQSLLFLKKKRKKKISIENPTEESNEIKKEKNSKINNQIQIIHKSPIQTQFRNSTNYSVTEIKMKDLANRTRIIRNQIEKITKDKKKRIEIKISPNKTRYGVKRFESRKNISQIFKRGNARLIRKSSYFIKFFREKIYIDIFLYIFNISIINTELFLESTKKLIEKYICNNKTSQERIDTTKKNTIKFLSNIKKSLLRFSSNINSNSEIHYDLSFLSQAYVFYKLSQEKIINLYLYKLKYKLKSVLQYHGTSLFLKKEIKDYFETQGITPYELRNKKLPNFGMNQWKKWLKSNYQYDLSHIKWSRLVPQKWRNTVNEHCKVENKNLKKKKWNSYEKEQLINYNYKNANNSEAHLLLLSDQKNNLKKNNRYDVLSSKFLDLYYEDKNDSYLYGLPFQIKKKQEFSYPYNYNIHKDKLVDMWCSIPITNYLGITNIMDIAKNTDRKYLDWKILHFSLRNKIDIGAWVDISTINNKNTKTEPKNYKIFDKMDNKGIFYCTIYQKINQSHQKKNLFDWMGMNEEILNYPILNLESWFFPEFFLLYNTYKMKPWVIPINLLFSNFIENKNINRKKKKNPFISSNENKFFELENKNHDENEFVGQGDLELNVQEKFESVFSNQQKNIEEGYTESDIKKRIKKKQDKSSTEAELYSFLKKYFLFQLKWNNSFKQKMIKNIKIYSFLLKLKNPRDITISSIEKGEINLNIMRIPKDLAIKELMKKRIFFIEPIRLSIKDDGQFILYQTINISLVHKSKRQNNQKRYNENVAKKNFDKLIPRYQRMMKNIDKNNYDLLAPENILSPRCRRELRILICFNSRNNNGVDKKPVFCNRNGVKNCSKFFYESKGFDRDKNQLIKLKLFLWPNYRLEDLACMNRYWFDTNNGSRFSILRIHMYPRLKINL
uniref:Translocon at the inner envelope membrane of chloroplasts 214 n=1 Tax=Pisonia aculeata TaxID=363212 RepID=A0A411JVI9_9CARY|nr:hypothetical protein RF1 [Pisonia aculeata]QBC69096.1 hypothetical protein RF1 [Pisonia aculeata]